MAGITTSPQLRESPETMNRQEPAGKSTESFPRGAWATQQVAQVTITEHARTTSEKLAAQRQSGSRLRFHRSMTHSFDSLHRSRTSINGKAAAVSWVTRMKREDEKAPVPYRLTKFAISFLPASVSTL